MTASFEPNAINLDGFVAFSRHRLVKTVRSVCELILLYAGQHEDRLNLCDEAVRASEASQRGLNVGLLRAL